MRSVAVLLIATLLLRPLFASDDVQVKLSPKMEKAIEKGLDYLAKKQNADGSWTASGQGKNVGIVSLALMAFMSVGNLPGEGKHGPVVAKGVDWIVKQGKDNGLIQYTKQQKQAAVMYGHALATLMLSEVWGQTRRKDIGQVLRKAADLIVRVQGRKGGWNYKSIPQDGDTSVCVMQIIALKSAHDAGIFVPDETIERALKLIKSRYDKKKAGYGYNNNRFNQGHPGSSAAGTTIMQICGEKDSEFTIKPLANHTKLMKEKKIKNWFYYFSYYNSVCSHHAGEKHYAKWVKVLEPQLLAKQRRDGSWHGIYKTAFAILAGAMPYRYLPIYQRQGDSPRRKKGSAKAPSGK